MKPYKKQYKESSLSRIWKHVTDPDTSFGVVSAYRQDKYSENQNLKRHEDLRKDIRSMGYGYIEQNSGYTYLNKEINSEIMVEEKSFFIPTVTFKDILKLGKKYEQESVLYKDEKGFGLYYVSGNLDIKFKTSEGIYSFKSSDIKLAYSELIKSNQGHKIKFSYVAEHYIPSRTEAYQALKTKKMPESKWIKIF